MRDTDIKSRITPYKLSMRNPFRFLFELVRSFLITSKLIRKRNNYSKIFLMMLERPLDAKTTQKTHKSECATDRPTDRPTDHTVEYRVAFTRLKTMVVSLAFVLLVIAASR